MGVLKIKVAELKNKSAIIKKVLEYFDFCEKKYTSEVLQKISIAAEYAFRDDILFEEFENWVSNHDN
jgi:hypothetical protein